MIRRMPTGKDSRVAMLLIGGRSFYVGGVGEEKGQTYIVAVILLRNESILIINRKRRRSQLRWSYMCNADPGDQKPLTIANWNAKGPKCGWRIDEPPVMRRSLFIFSSS